MMSEAMRRRSRRLGLLALSPLVVCFVLTPPLGIIVYLSQAFFLITIAIIVWIILWLSAIIAAVAWVRLQTMHRTEETRYIISMVVVFACIVGHPLLSIGSLWVLDAVFL
jgi:ABC-type siderophore export system fused ATPase/permease subunit